MTLVNIDQLIQSEHLNSLSNIVAGVEEESFSVDSWIDILRGHLMEFFDDNEDHLVITNMQTDTQKPDEYFVHLFKDRAEYIRVRDERETKLNIDFVKKVIHRQGIKLVEEFEVEKVMKLFAGLGKDLLNEKAVMMSKRSK